MTKTASRLAYFECLSLRICLVIGAWSLVILSVAGCDSGPARGDVKGKVTFKGNPVKEGRVTFLSPAGLGNSEAEIGSDGSYALTGGAVVGDYVVVVNPLVEIKDTDPGKSPPVPVEKKAPDIPQKYRMQGTTTLKATVKTGKNDINLEMTP